jgi:choline kinase
MGSLTEELPKCLLSFAGRRLLEWQIAALNAVGIFDVMIVTGYRAEQLSAFGTCQVRNPKWSTTNMVYSLACASDFLLQKGVGPVIVCYSDIVYEPRVLDSLLAAPGEVATVIDLCWEALWRLRFGNPLTDAETLTHHDGRILDIGRKATSFKEIEGQYIGLTRFTPGSAEKFLATYRSIHQLMPGKTPETCYFTDILHAMASVEPGVRAAFTEGGWLEFDSEDDLSAYSSRLAIGILSEFWSPDAVAQAKRMS